MKGQPTDKEAELATAPRPAAGAWGTGRTAQDTREEAVSRVRLDG
jgi:hypothetical protein